MRKQKYTKSFEREMFKVKSFLENKGFVSESDHIIANYMQSHETFSKACAWLKEHGYNGELDVMSNSGPEPIAVYGLYDRDKLTLEEMRDEMNKEAERQMSSTYFD